MSLWIVSMALAGEPVVVGGPEPIAPALQRSEIVLAWGEVGLRPAVPESPAIGPDRLAVGPDGRSAVYDPLGKRVLVVGGASIPVPAADGLAFTAAGILLVMDDRARLLRAYRDTGAFVAELPFPGVVPPGGTLAVDGASVLSVDVFGNGHPLATVSTSGALQAPSGPALVPAARKVVRNGTSLVVDGRAVATVEGRAGGRLVGDWLIVEAMDDGAVTRAAIPLDGGSPVSLPVRGRLYAPAQDVAVGPDGDLAWLDPRADGLHLVRVSP
ncbi:MAG: hypothetical protein ACK4YP_07610 [Myxococcota bacterium]